ncbi:MAG: hypothetical protein PUH48_03775 [Prevotella sp.]|nr:hypothetical protein [Prevotella sp.]
MDRLLGLRLSPRLGVVAPADSIFHGQDSRKEIRLGLRDIAWERVIFVYQKIAVLC